MLFFKFRFYITWFISDSRISVTRALSRRVTILYLLHAIFSQSRMPIQIKEVRVILAIEAIRFSRKLSRRATAKLYNVPETTIRDRMNDVIPKNDSRLGVQLLIKIEEDVIVQYILGLDSREFSPLIIDVREMVNHILESRGSRRVEKQWPYRFIQRRDELRRRFSRVYDFQRALCEDPELINAWFRLFQNIRTKYGVQDCDLYNFDETGFMMGMISSCIVVTRSWSSGKLFDPHFRCC